MSNLDARIDADHRKAAAAVEAPQPSAELPAPIEAAFAKAISAFGGAAGAIGFFNFAYGIV